MTATHGHCRRIPDAHSSPWTSTRHSPISPTTASTPTFPWERFAATREFAKCSRPFFEPIHENEFLQLRRAADGAVVFVERLDRHRLDHGWRELPVNSVFEVHDGLITVWRDYFDLMTAAKITDPNAT